MRYRRKATWLAFTLAAMSALATTSAAGAGATTETTVTRSAWETAVQGCTEGVMANGVVTTVNHLTIDAQGGTHQHIVGEVHAAGYGVDSGAAYRVQFGSVEVHLNAPSGGGLTVMDGRYQIIGLGQAPNTIGRDTFHVTVNALGEVTSFHLDHNVVCH